MTHHVFGQTANLEPRQNPFEIAPVQDVELAECDPPAADFFHRRLVFVAPGIGEGKPVERMAKRLEDHLGFARDAAAPVDQRTEHVEEASLGHLHDLSSPP